MTNRKIRVLQLIDGLTVGGAERVVLMLSAHADNSCFEMIPCALHRTGPLEDELRAAEIRYQVLGLRRRSIFTGPLFLADTRRILAALSEVIHKFSIDVVHAHLTRSMLFGILAARRAGLGVCASVHNEVLDSGRGRFSPQEWLLRAGINAIFSRADRIIGVSDKVTEVLQTSTRIPHQRIVTIPNGVDGERFQPRHDQRELRQQLQLPLERPIAISIGRMTRQKGYIYLLEALTRIPAETRPLVLLTGDGPDRHDLERKASELHLDEDVRFLGNRTDIPTLLAAADCFVMASLWEGLPLVLLEAMASGLPAVVTAVGGNPGVIEHGVSGLLVPPGEPQPLADAMQDLLGDTQQRKRLGEAARAHFQRHFSLSAFITAHEQLYRELCLEHPRPLAGVST